MFSVFSCDYAAIRRTRWTAELYSSSLFRTLSIYYVLELRSTALAGVPETVLQQGKSNGIPLGSDEQPRLA